MFTLKLNPALLPSMTSRTTRLMFRGGLTVALLTATLLVYLLVRAVDHRTLSDQNITYLLAVNAAIACILFICIIAIGLRLRRRLKEGRFGSKLLMKLAAIFALVGIVPGIIIYSVSYQFVSRSIESWFDVHVEAALEAGLNLGRATLDNLSSELSNKVRTSASALEMEDDVHISLGLEKLRMQVGADDAQIWSQTGMLVASSGDSRFQLSPDKPTPAQMRALKTQRSLTLFEGLDAPAPDAKANAKLKVIVPLRVSSLGLQTEQRYLQISQKLPSSLVSNALAVQSAHTEYQERSLSRAGLQKMYIGTLTLSLFLAVLGAFILAVVLGNQLVRPLLVLALGVERVSLGDLSPKLELQDDNELAGLTRSFASMTQQLADARVHEQKTERVKAWNEIAQRVAHEIKNPLTPIQLSAERLSHKLTSKLEGADLALLHKSVKTIVDQVEAMKRLVNEFRDYARLPSAQLLPLSLRTVIEDTLHLYDHEVQSGIMSLRMQEEASFDIQGDAQQLRQVIHNLLQNALDAVRGKAQTVQKSFIQVSIHLDIHTDQGEPYVQCIVEDNGTGFAPHILEHAFEPYNTTKPKGTGLGLAVVRKIVQEHLGQISLKNVGAPALVTGAQVRLLFPLIKT